MSRLVTSILLAIVSVFGLVLVGWVISFGADLIGVAATAKQKAAARIEQVDQLSVEPTPNQ